MPRASSHRLTLYVLANLAFALLLGIAYAAVGSPNPRLPHLVLLFALCSTPILYFDGLNGRYALLGLFMLVYFVSFGVGDLTNLFTLGDSTALASSQEASAVLNKPEAVILVGGILLVLGYCCAVLMVGAGRQRQSSQDWSRSTILTVGLAFWAIGTIATYRWNIYIVPDSSNEDLRKGLAGLTTAAITAYLVAQMCQPVGILLLAYAHRIFRSPYLMPLILTVVAIQLFIGFVVDVKGLAMLGIILVIMTGVLVNGRIPKMWLVGFILFVIFIFPFFQAYRGAIHGNVTRTAVVENFGKILEKTMAAKDKVNSGRDRAQTFLERSSVKASVEIVVARAGNGVPLQQGYTLSPILAAFIPKLLWSEKLRVPTGQLFNKAFHISDSDDVYISPSHLGELYWNYGWAGVLVGMPLIGLICGWVGARFNLAEFTTVTRVLVTVITIKLLIVGFEGSISDIYVVWLRSLAGIGILHLVFARIPVASRLFRLPDSGIEQPPTEHYRSAPLFPNLLT
jgi:hypothetical protein